MVELDSIRTKDPNNHSDTETGTLSKWIYKVIFHLYAEYAEYADYAKYAEYAEYA